MLRSVRQKRLLLVPGLEHSRGNSGDQAARNQSFAMRAEIIAETGNYVTFSRREGFQAGARDFFRGLGIFHEFFLAGGRVKFRFR